MCLHLGQPQWPFLEEIITLPPITGKEKNTLGKPPNNHENIRSNYV